MKTIKDIINDDYFKTRVHNNITEMVLNRLSRPQLKQGYKYLRDWYDVMSAEELTVEYFLKHILDIWDSKSTLSSIKRKPIRFVCDKSWIETNEQYAKLEQSKQIEK